MSPAPWKFGQTPRRGRTKGRRTKSWGGEGSRGKSRTTPFQVSPRGRPRSQGSGHSPKGHPCSLAPEPQLGGVLGGCRHIEGALPVVLPSPCSGCKHPPHTHQYPERAYLGSGSCPTAPAVPSRGTVRSAGGRLSGPRGAQPCLSACSSATLRGETPAEQQVSAPKPRSPLPRAGDTCSISSLGRELSGLLGTRRNQRKRSRRSSFSLLLRRSCSPDSNVKLLFKCH